MNFLEFLKLFIPALGFMAMGFAKDGGGKEDEEEEEEDEEEEEEDEDEEEEKDEKKFGHKYVKGLREEAKTNRIKAKKLQEALDKIEDDKLKADGEHEKRADKIQADAEKEKLVFVKRIKLSELKSWGSKNGIIDVQLVQLVKLDDLILDDDYSPTNLDEVMDEFKEKHPKLFEDNEDDDDDRDPEDNKKPRRTKDSDFDLDKMSGPEALRAHFSADGKDKKKKNRK